MKDEEAPRKASQKELGHIAICKTNRHCDGCMSFQCGCGSPSRGTQRDRKRSDWQHCQETERGKRYGQVVNKETTAEELVGGLDHAQQLDDTAVHQMCQMA